MLALVGLALQVVDKALDVAMTLLRAGRRRARRAHRRVATRRARR
jgi:hypothetical protein